MACTRIIKITWLVIHIWSSDYLKKKKKLLKKIPSEKIKKKKKYSCYIETFSTCHSQWSTLDVVPMTKLKLRLGPQKMCHKLVHFLWSEISPLF